MSFFNVGNMMIKNYLAIALGALIAVWVAYSSGLLVGANRQKDADSAQYLQDLTKALEESEKKVAAIEYDFSQKIKKGFDHYEEERNKIKSIADAQRVELGRLRAKSCYSNLSKAQLAATTTGSNGDTNTPGGGEPGEINLDGVANQIIELGRQLDEQNQKLIYLQNYAKSCADVVRL